MERRDLPVAEAPVPASDVAGRFVGELDDQGRHAADGRGRERRLDARAVAGRAAQQRQREGQEHPGSRPGPRAPRGSHGGQHTLPHGSSHRTRARRALGFRAMKRQHPSSPRQLFPEIEPYRSGKLRVSMLHTLHFEECGNPRGQPLVFLHGGPGGGIDPTYPRYFDPRKWRVVLFDQRGCGKSTPHAELRENTTWDLVADVERLREELGIERWVVFGGSWGSTLSLAYADTQPDRCKPLVLPGIFILRRSELDWFYQEGASHRFPDAWETYLEPIPPKERGEMMRAYYTRLTSRDRGVRMRAARAWSVWEGTTSKLFFDPELVKKFSGGRFADA